MQTNSAPGEQPAAEGSHRPWAERYRRRWRWDNVVKGTHLLNCWYQRSCAYNVYVKDGAVPFEEPVGGYPRTNSSVPDFNPRGCQKGACYALNMKQPARVTHPLKRVGGRGQGAWQQVTWDQALTDIADSNCLGSGWCYYDNDPAAGAQPDWDGDGYINSEEDRIFGSQRGRTDMCGTAGWPSDTFEAGASFNVLSVQDVTAFVAGADSMVGANWPTPGVPVGDPRYKERYNLFNLAPSTNEIDNQDITALVTGTRLRPPMFYFEPAGFYPYIPGGGRTCPVAP